MLAVPVCPSWLVAVTVYVWLPGVDVSSVPDVPDPPFESVHDRIPGPPEASEQLKLVATT